MGGVKNGFCRPAYHVGIAAVVNNEPIRPAPWQAAILAISLIMSLAFISFIILESRRAYRCIGTYCHLVDLRGHKPLLIIHYIIFMSWKVLACFYTAGYVLLIPRLYKLSIMEFSLKSLLRRVEAESLWLMRAYFPCRIKKNISRAAMLLASQISPEAISWGIWSGETRTSSILSVSSAMRRLGTRSVAKKQWRYSVP